MEDQIFKNQYALERMIVWLINTLEFNLRQFCPLEKMVPEKNLESATPKKVNSANLPPGKIYFEIETPGKSYNRGTSWIFTSIPLYRQKME